jgi:chemotaxis protein CheD
VGRAGGNGTLNDRIKVSIADYAVASGETITTSGLGSCLGIALYDASAGVGGLAHPMLPERSDDARRPPERFVDTGIEALFEALLAAGASRANVEARLTGGAAIVDFDSDDGPSIGDRNIETAHEVLSSKGITVVGEETGGDCGRTMRFDTDTGEVTVERTDGVDTVL